MTAIKSKGFSMSATLAERNARQTRLEQEKRWGDVAVAHIKKVKVIDLTLDSEELARWRRLAEVWPNRIVIARNALTKTYRVALRRD